MYRPTGQKGDRVLKKALVFDNRIQNEMNPIVFIDVGARTDLPEPWRSLEEEFKGSVRTK